MDVADWIAIGVAMIVLVFGGGGFWLWVRKLSADVAVLQAWAKQIDGRCDRRGKNMERSYDNIGEKIGRVHARVDDLHKCVAEKDSLTAKAVGRLEGKMESLLGGEGKVRT